MVILILRTIIVKPPQFWGLLLRGGGKIHFILKKSNFTNLKTIPKESLQALHPQPPTFHLSLSFSPSPPSSGPIRLWSINNPIKYRCSTSTITSWSHVNGSRSGFVILPRVLRIKRSSMTPIPIRCRRPRHALARSVFRRGAHSRSVARLSIFPSPWLVHPRGTPVFG